LSWLLGHFLTWIEEGCIYVVNLLIQSIADAANFVLSHLPDIPTAPTFSGSYLDWVSYGQYWFPITYLLALGATMLTLYLAYYVIAIPLRWFKVVRGSE
jgi:hypothetical protein